MTSQVSVRYTSSIIAVKSSIGQHFRSLLSRVTRKSRKIFPSTIPSEIDQASVDLAAQIKIEDFERYFENSKEKPKEPTDEQPVFRLQGRKLRNRLSALNSDAAFGTSILINNEDGDHLSVKMSCFQCTNAWLAESRGTIPKWYKFPASTDIVGLA
ncbi:hypothetical protein N7495_009955 [Penicillium taxi]|uniref:uncharacterized protein n=1 Tax=Penicillium taxi TaxID=168475 RepID=UPI002544EE6B|nr:uncharacterized protein N7495_009955 [Penicillium taxi]KAJ5885445.1 hypothetical protein N7495_009955 [Penicillium taxi]